MLENASEEIKYAYEDFVSGASYYDIPYDPIYHDKNLTKIILSAESGEGGLERNLGY